MKPPTYEPPVCCENHTSRFVPTPETEEETFTVAQALERWDESFYELENGNRPDWEALPDYVVALLP